MKLSIVIPIYNEEQNVKPLAERLKEAFNNVDFDYEFIFVDDGSTDNTFKELELLKEQEGDKIKLIKFVQNFGQTAAMAAGIQKATGDCIAPLDADLQNDPLDIPKMVELYNQGYDVVSGWRKKRKDDCVRTFFSRTANRLISKITNVKLHDYGCSLKLYNAEKLKKVCLTGELHRFIPALVSRWGRKITEIESNHHPRLYGSSKYNLSRTVRVILDLITVALLSKYNDRPMYFFGYIAIFTFFCSVALSIAALLLKSIFLCIFGASFFIISFILICAGLISELLLRIYLKLQNNKTYMIEKDI